MVQLATDAIICCSNQFGCLSAHDEVLQIHLKAQQLARAHEKIDEIEWHACLLSIQLVGYCETGETPCVVLPKFGTRFTAGHVERAFLR